MYRGMHHPSDVAGALLLTVLWVGLLVWVVRPNADLTAGNAADAGELGDADPATDLDAVPSKVPAPRPAGAAVPDRR
jgi:undecaprenyl-diphosphatase